MKSNSTFYVLFTILFALLTNQTGVCKNGTDISTTYTVPFKPGDAKWNSFKTPTDRIRALQISASVITKIPTRQLLSLCLNFPYLTDMYAFDDSQEGLRYLLTEYNGYDELLKRDDVMEILQEEYSKIESAVPFLQKLSTYDKGLYSLQCDCLVKLINLVNKKNKLSRNVVERLFVQTEKNMDVIKSHPELFGSMCKESISKTINELGSRFLNVANDNDIIRNNEGDIYRKSTRSTPSGTEVTVCTLLSEDFDSILVRAIMDDINRNYKVTFLDYPTRKYNGHGYAWHMQDGHLNDKVWIGLDSDQNDDKYRTDGSYYSVPPDQATHVLYSNEHTSIKLPNGQYRTKLGAWPLIAHDNSVVFPNMGSPIGYYKKYTPSLSGDNLITSTLVFSIDPLPSGYSVEWNLSDNYYNQHCLQQNYPAQNKCTINRSNNQNMTNATLTATIKYNGRVVRVLTKTGLYAYKDFYGQYTSDDISGIIDYTHIFYVKPGSRTIISSPNLMGKASVTHDNLGIEPLYPTLDLWQGKYYFTMPTNNGGIPVVLNVNDVLGNHYQLYAIPRNSYYLNISYTDDNIVISLNNDDSTREISRAQQWSYEIRNTTKGELKTSKKVNSNSTSISTAGWQKGIYVIKARIDKEEATEKILVK